jgi:hypothetical protein
MRNLFLVFVVALGIFSVVRTADASESRMTFVHGAQAVIIGDFSARVRDYVNLRRSVEDSLARRTPSKDSAEIAVHKIELAAVIVSARPDAHQGDIFTPSTAAKFSDVIRKTLQSPDAQAVRRTLQDKDPAKPVVVRVNSVYPEDSPLQTMPPTLLKHLPDLPMDMAYRIIGRTFVLLDNKTRLIIDFIPDAIP